jgi:hypothetical protein
LELLKYLPKRSVFCEVGVAYGDFTAEVLAGCVPRKFIAIDCFDLEDYPAMWGFARLEGGTHETFYRRRFAPELASGRMELHRGYSNEVLPRLPDESVDIFYIDAWHSYEAVSEELAIIKTKVRPRGWILLNDYTLYDVVSETPYGVVQAAHEFMLAEGWEMKFLALHPLMFCDIALRKMNPGSARSPDGKVRQRAAVPRRRRPAAQRVQPVSLVVWAADVLREQGETVIALARRGIMSSLCLVVEDPTAMRAALERDEIWDYLIFPSLAATAKLARVATIIATAEFRLPSVLLIDDDAADRAQIAAVLPGLQVADTGLLPRILADPRLVGADDAELARLARYRIYQRREAAGHSGGAPIAAPPLRIAIEPDVAAHLDRAIELIDGTRRLNFTRRRLPDDLAAARAQLLGEIAPHYVQAGLVRIEGEDADYGYCGFYRMTRQQLLDYCFSRSILGLGVEAWLYQRLGRPALAPIAEPPSDLASRPPFDRAASVLVGGDPAPPIPEVRLRGGPDIAALAHYFGFVAERLAVETNDYRGPLFLQLDSSTMLLPALGGAPPGFHEAVRHLGYREEDFSGGFLDPAPPGSVLVYSPGADLYLPLYRHETQGFAIPVTLDIYRDLTTIDDDALTAALAEGYRDDAARRQVRETVAALRAEYRWEPRLAPDAALGIARRVFDRIPAGARLFLVLPSEQAKWGDALEPRPEAVAYNALMRALIEGYPAVTVVAIDEILGDAQEVQGFDQFDRIVYFRLYQRIVSIIAANSAPAP